MPPFILGCIPGGLHPVSREFLDAWLAGHMSTENFRRFFHLPNSDYLEAAQCIVALIGVSG
jgi:hypothetical protein